MSFAKNRVKIIGKNISKNLSSKCSQKRLDHAKQSATDTLKTASKRAIGKKKKTAEATTCLTGNKIADRISKISKNSPKNNSETNEEEEEIVRERYISPEQRQKIIDDLILIYYNIIMEN